jgi:hypothetical protein
VRKRKLRVQRVAPRQTISLTGNPSAASSQTIVQAHHKLLKALAHAVQIRRAHHGSALETKGSIIEKATIIKLKWGSGGLCMSEKIKQTARTHFS